MNNLELKLGVSLPEEDRLILGRIEEEFSPDVADFFQRQIESACKMLRGSDERTAIYSRVRELDKLIKSNQLPDTLKQNIFSYVNPQGYSHHREGVNQVNQMRNKGTQYL